MRRRAVVGGAGLAGLAGAGTWAYRTGSQIRRQSSRDRERAILPAPARPTPKSWSDRGLYAAWLGHTTVLMKIDGFTILTDPVLSNRVGIDLKLFTVGLKRLVKPALALEDLPKIDLVLLSHAHFDHFDLPTLRRLENRGTAVVTAAKTSDLLRVRHYGVVHELGWGGRVPVGPLEIRAFRVKHWGARMRSDTYRGYNGYTLEAGRYRVLFGGDTAFTTSFRPLKTSRPFDLAVMPIGAYNPWIHSHSTPEQSLQMANDAGAEFFLPVHHQTFTLSREPYLEPIERAYAAAGRNTDRIAVHQIGQEFHFPV